MTEKLMGSSGKEVTIKEMCDHLNNLDDSNLMTEGDYRDLVGSGLPSLAEADRSMAEFHVAMVEVNRTCDCGGVKLLRFYPWPSEIATEYIDTCYECAVVSSD